ncbi:MAG TPA: class I SAM-dependent methyltransferase, partial [candidate division Zixibacteria bacterium]|nr:class I SAM-dependent methyltransferase [candidate division Zixibacteria bacterium]
AAVARTFNLERQITAVDISPKMLERARSCFAELGLSGIVCREGRAEELPVEDNSQDLILASLSFMYVVDRAAAAREIARALTPDGKFIAVVWGSRDNTDIVRFQEIAGSFAPTPPVTAVGPGSLGDPQPFVTALQEQGLTVTVDSIVTTFEFPDFDTSWVPLAGVTAKKLDKDTLHRARAAVYSEMWPDGDGPRVFQNTTQYITAVKSP